MAVPRCYSREEEGPKQSKEPIVILLRGLSFLQSEIRIYHCGSGSLTILYFAGSLPEEGANVGL